MTLSGLLMIGLGMFMAISAAGQYAAGQPIAGGIRTTGTVVGVQTGQNCGKGGCSEYWVASIRFTTSDGKTVVFRGPEQSTITDGTRVAVSYDPHDPSGAHDLSVGVGSKLFFVAFGTFIAAFGLLFLVARIDWAHRRIVVTPVPLPEAGRYQRFSRTGPGVVVNAALVAGVVVLLVVLLF